MVSLHFCVFCIVAEVFLFFVFDKLCKIEQLVSPIHFRVGFGGRLFVYCMHLLHKYHAFFFFFYPEHHLGYQQCIRAVNPNSPKSNVHLETN